MNAARALVARVLVAATLLLCTTGCNVIALKQAGIERTMRDAGMAPADVKIGSDSIHYWAGGQGPTVLLVHGFGASAMWLWYPQVADLARDHRVILPDLLWFGESRSSDRDFSLDHQVHAVEALLDNARHAPNLEHPDEFNRILRGFLSSGGRALETASDQG
jgi:pimeloyl-ACP methyl ester carboxylesterase